MLEHRKVFFNTFTSVFFNEAYLNNQFHWEMFIPAYFPHIGRLNQLLVLSQQLDEDVKHLGSHKYIAHQLSAIYVSLFDFVFSNIFSIKSLVLYIIHMCLFLLQQVLNSLKDVLPLSIIRKDIEANFKQLKMSLSTEEGSKLDPQLPAHHVSWWEWLNFHVLESAISNPE